MIQQRKVATIVDMASETVIVRYPDHLDIIFAAAGVSLSFLDVPHARAFLRQLDITLRGLLGPSGYSVH
jgi:hypothetical protein